MLFLFNFNLIIYKVVNKLIKGYFYVYINFGDTTINTTTNNNTTNNNSNNNNSNNNNNNNNNNVVLKNISMFKLKIKINKKKKKMISL
ncbi:hypothetical protein PFUGPA_03396 [Plasmodium falciparum Palo Alto/Uganda]|uniref:Uncharacterized protein n=1 Tax=Plasmodium falciparum (isolate Palo Alto / Uganda) TaxID=57270 RepID=W4IY98_PLAFP|nr:hypothetical protein PFUGPA_03396 [Plasmodium falciparum Palo Alto/Uganda]